MAAEAVMAALSGGANTTHPMDSQGRVSIASNHRSILPEDLVIVPSNNKSFPSLWIYPKVAYDRWVEAFIQDKATTLNLAEDSNELRFLKAKMHGQEKPIAVNQVGRILIPKDLREYASLDKEVRIIGAGEYLEVWDEETYIRYDEHYSNKINIFVDYL